MARAFDDRRRSTALIQLLNIINEGLLTNFRIADGQLQRERRIRPTRIQVRAVQGLSYEDAETKPRLLTWTFGSRNSLRFCFFKPLLTRSWENGYFEREGCGFARGFSDGTLR